MKPRLLDLYCGAGGCSAGYAAAGFEVVGVDNRPQPNYPFEFVQDDALQYLHWLTAGSSGPYWLHDFSAIHASPPCQAHSSIAKQARKLGWTTNEHPDLVAPTRTLLAATGLPYIIENVPGAPLHNPAQLCGSSLGLDVRRHRLFETNWPLMTPPCAHGAQFRRFRIHDNRRKLAGTTAQATIAVDGHTNYTGEAALRNAAMQIDWMTQTELAQAIPPAYTELIGHQLLAHIRPAA